MSLDQISEQKCITSDRFDLRPVRESDRGLIRHYGSDIRVAGNTTSIPHPLPPGSTEAYVKRVTSPDRDQDVWAIDGTRQGGPELMGLISLKRMDREQSEIAYWVAPAFWNTGLASDAVHKLVAENPRDNATMFACVFQDNPASARVLTNCGFEYIGDAEAFSVARNATISTWTYLKKLK